MERFVIKKSIILFFALFSTCVLFPQKTEAQVLINEFSSWGSSGDWVELYNLGTETVDLENYVIRDSTSTNKIMLNGVIASGGFATFSFSKWLNKDKDIVRLLKIQDDSEIQVDSIAYGNEEQVCPPGEGESVGRITDGGNTIERFARSSKNTTNDGNLLDSCPSPTPLSTPTSLPTPSPTSSPKPPLALSPTPTSTQIKNNPVSQTVTPTISYQVNNSKTASDDSVLAATMLTDDGEVGSHEPSLEKDDKETANTFTVLFKKVLVPAIFLLAGLVFLGYSIFLVIKKNKKIYNFRNEK